MNQYIGAVITLVMLDKISAWILKASAQGGLALAGIVSIISVLIFAGYTLVAPDVLNPIKVEKRVVEPPRNPDLIQPLDICKNAEIVTKTEAMIGLFHSAQWGDYSLGWTDSDENTSNGRIIESKFSVGYLGATTTQNIDNDTINCLKRRAVPIQSHN